MRYEFETTPEKDYCADVKGRGTIDLPYNNLQQKIKLCYAARCPTVMP